MSGVKANSADSGNGADIPLSYGRRFVATTVAMLPFTALLLYLLTFVDIWDRDWDILGLIAVSVGIVGVLIFYILLYKYEMHAYGSRRSRWAMLAGHAGLTALLFFGLIWLGIDSPWAHSLVWATYDMQTACKPWIISVLVIGTLSGLGILFDMLGDKFFNS